MGDSFQDSVTNDHLEDSVDSENKYLVFVLQYEEGRSPAPSQALHSFGVDVAK